MAIDVIVQYSTVQYNGGSLPDNLLFSLAPIFTVQWYYYRILLLPFNYVVSTALAFVLNCLVAWHGDYCKCTV